MLDYGDGKGPTLKYTSASIAMEWTYPILEPCTCMHDHCLSHATAIDSNTGAIIRAEGRELTYRGGGLSIVVISLFASVILNGTCKRRKLKRGYGLYLVSAIQNLNGDAYVASFQGTHVLPLSPSFPGQAESC